MGLLRGAVDLGLVTKWRFGFVGLGHRADTTPGVVYLDTGGQLKQGVLDHHGIAGVATGTAPLVLQHPELAYNHLLEPWLRGAEDAKKPGGVEWSPTLVTHGSPDWDAIVGVYLVIELIEKGEFPPYAQALAAYTEMVDQGRYRFKGDETSDAEFAPHLAYLAVQNLEDESGRLLASETQLRRGLELIRRIVAQIEQARSEQKKGPIRTSADFMPPSPGTTLWKTDPWFTDLASLIASDRKKFSADSADATKAVVTLPAKDGGDAISAEAWIAAGPTRSVMNKYWARGDGFQFTIIPIGDDVGVQEADRAKAAPRYRRVILSLDPASPAMDRRPDLQGLGYALEQAEVKARNTAQGRDDRGGSPRFPEGYCLNADPWYDGRAHDFTIVDSPNSGTALSYAEICAIATSASFWKLPVDRAAVMMAWVDPNAPALAEGDRKPENQIPPLPSRAKLLDEYAAETFEIAEKPVETTAEGCQILRSWRYAPDGTAPPMKLVQIQTTSGATLDHLVDLHNRLKQVEGGRPPDYIAVRVSLGPHFSNPKRVGQLLRRLANGDVRPLELGDAAQELLLFNNRTLIFQGALTDSDSKDPDPDAEAFFYAAFVKESLIDFSHKLSQLLPKRTGVRINAAATGLLRRNILRFHTRHYHREVSVLPRGHALFGELAHSLDLDGHLTEVQRQLDRLSEIEAQSANAAIENILFVVGVLGALQTLAAVWTLPPTAWESTLFLTILGTVLALAAIPLAVRLWRRYESR